MVGLVAVTVVVIVRGASTVSRPAGLVALEALAAVADMAAEKWKWKLAFASIFPVAGILVDYLDPQWRQQILHAFGSSWGYLTFHTHSYMVWPMLFAGMNEIIKNIGARRGWRVTLARLVGTTAGIWSLLVAAEAYFTAKP
jgi:hypothetical protein